MLRRVAIALVVTGCAAGTSALPAAHPASTTAPVGRLAPAPASLRAGVVTYPDVPAMRAAAPVDHSHHHGM